jgi:hypothetical protein
MQQIFPLSLMSNGFGATENGFETFEEEDGDGVSPFASDFTSGSIIPVGELRAARGGRVLKGMQWESGDRNSVIEEIENTWSQIAAARSAARLAAEDARRAYMASVLDHKDGQ